MPHSYKNFPETSRFPFFSKNATKRTVARRVKDNFALTSLCVFFEKLGIVSIAIRKKKKKKIKESGDLSEGVDSISTLPDEILQHILSSIPTIFAIRSSVLSRRWRHVWSDTPSLYFHDHWDRPDANSINETLARYRAPKMTSFRIYTSMLDDLPYMDSWIKFALSRNVENLSLDLDRREYNIPHFRYVNSSLKQLSIESNFSKLIPKCSVSWTSLKKLSLITCNVPDESIAKILSGCPVLETLRLRFCDELKVLDLSKSPRLKTLVIHSDSLVPGPTKIVAPYIHCLRLRNSQLLCDLVDVSSLTEAKLNISYYFESEKLNADFLHIMVLEMLEKYQNVEKFTFGENFLKILSLAELRGVLFPKFKAKALTLETAISHYVVPGIVRVLQNSPELKKLTLTYTTHRGFIPSTYIDENLRSHGLNTDQCWNSEARVFKDICPLRANSWFIELVLKTTKTLEKMVVRLEPYLNSKGFMKELLEMVPVLTDNNNVISSTTRSRLKM